MRRTGWYGWAAVTVAVVAYDVPAVKRGWQTMSACNPWITVPAMLYLAAHFASVIPAAYDPLERARMLLSPRS